MIRLPWHIELSVKFVILWMIAHEISNLTGPVATKDGRHFTVHIKETFDES